MWHLWTKRDDLYDLDCTSVKEHTPLTNIKWRTHSKDIVPKANLKSIQISISTCNINRNRICQKTEPSFVTAHTFISHQLRLLRPNGPAIYSCKYIHSSCTRAQLQIWANFRKNMVLPFKAWADAPTAKIDPRNDTEQPNRSPEAVSEPTRIIC